MLITGLEFHVALATKTKLFCSCTPSVGTCPICRGFPGYIPQPVKQEVLILTKRILDVLNCKINPLEFYRKHYFYHDLPKGYQLTQHPLKTVGVNGQLILPYTNKKIVFEKVSLEEDPCSTKAGGYTDFSRSGNPLLELTTGCFTITNDVNIIKELWWTLKRLCVDLGLTSQESTMKVDVNVSLPGEPRVEVKNLNSLSDILEVYDTAPSFLDLKERNSITAAFQKGKIKKTRSKQDYLFSKEYNLPIVKITPTLADKKKTLYQCIMAITDRTSNKAFSLVLAKKYYKSDLALSYPCSMKELKELLDSDKSSTALKKPNVNKILLDSYPIEKQSFKCFITRLKNQLRTKYSYYPLTLQQYSILRKNYVQRNQKENLSL